MSKYEPLWNYVKDNKKEEYQLSFDDIEKIIGFPIVHSFLTYKKELLNYHYEVVKISMKEKMLSFEKIDFDVNNHKKE